jgi:hypothetical protein
VYNSELSAALIPPKQRVIEENGGYKQKIIPRRPNSVKTIDFPIPKIMNSASTIATPRRTPLLVCVRHIAVQVNSKQAPLLGHGRNPRRMGSLCGWNPLLGETHTLAVDRFRAK